MFEIELPICIKMDLALNNLQRLICHKTQTTNQHYLDSISSCWYVLLKTTDKDLVLSFHSDFLFGQQNISTVILDSLKTVWIRRRCCPIACIFGHLQSFTMTSALLCCGVLEWFRVEGNFRMVWRHGLWRWFEV